MQEDFNIMIITKKVILTDVIIINRNKFIVSTQIWIRIHNKSYKGLKANLQILVDVQWLKKLMPNHHTAFT